MTRQGVSDILTLMSGLEKQAMKSVVQPLMPWLAAGQSIGGSAANNLTTKVGLWSALLATGLNIGFTVALVAVPGRTWRGMYEFASDYSLLDLLPALFAFLLGPTIVALFAAIHSSAPPEKKVLSQLAFLFSGGYAALTGINYFVQMTVVRQHMLTGETAGLALFVMANPASLMLAVDMLGYFFLFLASLCAATIFETSRLNDAIRWLLAATGALGLVGVIGYMVGNEMMSFAGLMISGVAFLPATALLAALFRGLGPSARSSEELGGTLGTSG